MTSTEEHKVILDEVKAVRSELERHIEEDHDYMPSEVVKEILDGQTELLTTMQKQQNIMADVVLGQAEETYDGEVVRSGGIAHIVEQYNGKGFKIQIPWGKIITLVSTIVTVVGAIVVAVIEVTHP
jgi:hypothetical protein